MLYCLFLQDVAYPLISDTFPHVSGTGGADGKTAAKGPLHDYVRVNVPVRKGETAILTSQPQPIG